jgi:hypothetical protein
MTDDTTPQEDAAMSPVSTGSLAHAWLVYAEDASESLFVTLRKEQADAAARDWGWGVAPLFVGLTQAEQDAIRLGELAYPGLRITDKGKWVDVWATLRGLVERQNRIVCDTKIDTTPGDGTVQNEGSVVRWTDLTIQKPPLNEEVLVLTDDGCHVCAYRQGDGLSGCYFEREDMKVFHDVTHWMRIPDQPMDAE